MSPSANSRVLESGKFSGCMIGDLSTDDLCHAVYRGWPTRLRDRGLCSNALGERRAFARERRRYAKRKYRGTP